MTSATFENSTLYATHDGSVCWAPGNRVRVILGGTGGVVASVNLLGFQETVDALVQQATERRSGHRWRVRAEGNPPVTLTSHELRQLSALLEGAVTMLELEQILDGADVGLPRGV